MPDAPDSKQTLPLSYRMPGARPARLLRLKVLGVVGIVVGVVECVGNLIVLPLLGIWLVASIRRVPPSPAPVAVAAIPDSRWAPVPTTLPINVTPFSGEVLGERGLPAQQRAVAVEALSKAMNLDRSQRAMLNLLLREKGRDVIPAKGAVTEQSVTELIEAQPTSPEPRAPRRRRTRGRRPNQQPAKSDSSQLSIRLQSGAIELHPGVAKFTDAGGHWFEVEDHFGDGGVCNDPVASWRLSSASIQSTIERVRNRFGPNACGSAQATGVVFALRGIAARPDAPCAAQPTSRSAGGTIELSVPSLVGAATKVWIDPMGRNLVNPPPYLDMDTFQPRPIAPPPPVMTTRPSFVFMPGQIIAMMAECAASVLVAALLLTASIRAFRQSPRAARTGKLYGWIGITLALVDAALVFGWNFDLCNWLGLPAPSLTESAVGSLITLLLASALPVAFLITMRSRAVREIFAPAA